MTKITFISPHYSNIWESIGIGILSSYLKHNYKGKLDISFFHENFDPITNIINEAIMSDIVAFSCTACTYQRGVMYAKIIKESNPKVHIVMGGWHTTTTRELPSEYIDQIVVGEGEKALLKIIEGNRDKIIYGDLLDFDDLFWPDRELINQKRQLDFCEKQYGERIVSFQSRRGCPMGCTICAEKHMSCNIVRVRNPLDLLDELDYVNKVYNLSKFKFVDPTWNYPRSASIEFCEEKIKRNNKIPWEAMGHAAFLDKDILNLMKASGCKQINIGVESGSQTILNEINKGVTPNKIKKVFKLGKSIGLDMRAFFILGLPQEMKETIEETKQLIRDINPDVFGITLLAMYPGTLYYRDEFKNVDWSKCGEYTNDFWYTKNFTNEQLKLIIREFNNEFYDKLVKHQKDNI